MYELTSTSQFLISECKDDIKLKKPDKASLSREIVSQLPQETRNVQSDAQMTIVDFMALVRKLPMKMMDLHTFGEVSDSLSNNIIDIGSASTRIYIVFDVYQTSSIKQIERGQRRSSGQITITIRSDNQKLSVDLDMFWSSMFNKVRLQEYVFKWMLQNVESDKEIFFGGVYGVECKKMLACTETQREREREREMFYLTTHSTHFIYGYMASDIWLRTILIVRKETRCRHIGYSYRLAARVLLYAPSHRQDITYHGLCYTSRGALARTRNSSMGPLHEGSIRRPTAP